MVNTIGSLLGIDLSAVNPDLLFIITSIFLLLVVSFFYDLLMMLFGYIGGKRK